MKLSEIKEQLEFADNFNLQYLLTLEPKEIVKWFESKGLVLSPSWRETILLMRNNVFTVSGMARMDLLNDVYKLVLEAIKEGKTIGQFKDEIKEKLVMRGYLSDNLDSDAEVLLSPWRMNLVYRQNLQNAFVAGRYRGNLRNTKMRPYWRVTGILDNNTAPMDRDLQTFFEDKVLRYDHPFWNTHIPPYHFLCRCNISAYTGDEVERNGWQIIRRMNSKQFVPMKGFGRRPDIPIEPDLSKYESPVKKFAEELFK